MGCSASKLDVILHTKSDIVEDPTPTPPPPPPSISSSSHSSSSKSSSKTLALSAPVLVHHFPLKKGDTHHLVSLTSSSYGSLVVDVASPDCVKMDPMSPDSVINTWELMEGLDENDEFVFVENEKHLSEEMCNNGNEKSISRPLWKHLSEEALLSKMDPNVVSSYQRALSSRKLGYDSSRVVVSKLMGSSPRQSFCVVSSTSSVSSSPVMSDLFSMKMEVPVCEEDRIVLYFTSLRGIRRTYEDCCVVRMILRGLCVLVDERDICMDSTYRKELQDALKGKPMSLPQVFISGKHIGGAEEIKQMHESGELAKLLVRFPSQDYGFTCEGCGGARFVPCLSCNGSRKVFVEEEGQLRRCADCNENGLIHCPACRS